MDELTQSLIHLISVLPYNLLQLSLLPPLERKKGRVAAQWLEHLAAAQEVEGSYLPCVC